MVYRRNKRSRKDELCFKSDRKKGIAKNGFSTIHTNVSRNHHTLPRSQHQINTQGIRRPLSNISSDKAPLSADQSTILLVSLGIQEKQQLISFEDLKSFRSICSISVLPSPKKPLTKLSIKSRILITISKHEGMSHLA